MKSTVFTRQKPLMAIICSALVIVFLIVILTVSTIIKSKKLQIAFYGLDPNVTEALQSVILKTKKDAQFTVLDADKPLPKNTASKYKILFTYNGKSVMNFTTKAKTLPPNYYRLLPSSIAKKPSADSKIMPVLLDHYELAFYRTYRNDNNLDMSTTLAELDNYLLSVKKSAAYPLLCAGGEDDQMYGFISSFAEALLGSDAYSKMCSEITWCAEKRYDFPDSFKAVLDAVKLYQTSGLTHKNWFQIKNRDIEHFMEEHTAGVLSMSLSEHRNKKHVLIKYYDSQPFPPKSSSANHGLVSPQIVALMFKDNSAGASRVIESLVQTDNQRILSDLTRLAPVSSKAESHDMQSDDVRFWAASNPTGPLNDIALECFDDPEKRAEYAQKIRDYLRL